MSTTISRICFRNNTDHNAKVLTFTTLESVEEFCRAYYDRRRDAGNAYTEVWEMEMPDGQWIELPLFCPTPAAFRQVLKETGDI